MQSERSSWLSWMGSGAIGSLFLLPFWAPWASAANIGPLSFTAVLLFTALSISLFGGFFGLLLYVVSQLSASLRGRIGVTLFAAVPLFVAQWMLTRGAWIQQQWWRWPALLSMLAIELFLVWISLRAVSRMAPSSGMTVGNDGQKGGDDGQTNNLWILAFAGMTILCLLADRYLLPGLYLPFHMGAITAAILFASFVGVLGWRRASWVRWASPLVMVLLIPAGYWLLQMPSAWGAVSRSAGVGKAISAVAVAIGVGPKLPSATQSTVKQLEWPEGKARPSLQNADVILITIDALRADRLGTYGSTKNITPNLDALAKKSVVFSRAYSPSPTSSYSLASMFCSRYAFGQMKQEPAHWATLAEHMAANGYRTYATYNEGIFFTDKEKFTGFAENGFGFQKRRVEYMDSYEISRASLANLNEAKGPAFVWLHIAEPHEPYQVRPGFDRGPTPEDRYDAEVWYADRHLEQLLKPIEGRNAIVIVAADHGEAFGEHGSYYHTSDVYAEQAHIPLFIYYPGVEPRVIDSPQGLVDLAPTLLDLLGLPPLPEAQGRSIAPLLVGQTPDEAPIFSEWKNRRAIAVGDHRLLCDTMTNACELYDSKTDVEERNDLSMAQPELATALAAKLNAFLSSQESQRDSFVWPEPIERLSRHDASQAENALPFLADSNPKVREKTAELLANVELAREPLMLATKDEAREVRLAAALSLASLHDARAIEPLRALLQDETLARAEIFVALGTLQSASADELSEAIVARDVELSKRVIEMLVTKGERTPKVEASLIAALSIGPLTERSAQALGALHAAASVPALIEALTKTTQIPARAAISEALGRLKDAAAIPALVARAALGEAGDHVGESLVALGGAPPAFAAGGLAPLLLRKSKTWRCDSLCAVTKGQAELVIKLPEGLEARPYILFLSAQGEGDLALSINGAPTKVSLSKQLSDLRIPLAKELLTPGATLKIVFSPSSTFQLSLAMILPVPEDESIRYK